MRERTQNSGCGPATLAAAMIAFVVACGIVEVRSSGVAEEEEQEGIVSLSGPVCCVSGFEYLSGYDWNGDVEAGEARCSLVVFADGIPKIKVAAGDGYEVSRDHDMHRVVNGNLYTFHSKGGKTVIKRNGSPLFRYDGDEVLMEMVVLDEDVYTITHKRSGSGHSFRKNGTVLLERFSGETFGKFWMDGDSLCFAFVQPVAEADVIEYDHYIVYDSKPVIIPEPEGAERIWDMMSCKGSPCVLASMRGTGETYLVRADSRKQIEIPDSAGMLACSLFQADSLIGTECMYSYPDGICGSGIWVEGGEYMRFESGSSIQASKFAGGKVFCTLYSDEKGAIFNAGEIVAMPDGYFCVGGNSLAVHDGELYVALSSETGGPPIIWHDHQLDTLRLNGCVSSITFTSPDKDYSSQVRVRD